MKADENSTHDLAVPQGPTNDLLLHPVAPGAPETSEATTTPVPRSVPKPISSGKIPEAQKEKKRPTLGERMRKERQTKYTIADAFSPAFTDSYGERENFNFEKAIRAVGFLSEFLSEEGNEVVDGFVANAFGNVLFTIADKFHYVRAHYERKIEGLREELERAKNTNGGSR